MTTNVFSQKLKYKPSIRQQLSGCLSSFTALGLNVATSPLELLMPFDMEGRRGKKTANVEWTDEAFGWTLQGTSDYVSSFGSWHPSGRLHLNMNLSDDMHYAIEGEVGTGQGDLFTFTDTSSKYEFLDNLSIYTEPGFNIVSKKSKFVRTVSGDEDNSVYEIKYKNTNKIKKEPRVYYRYVDSSSKSKFQMKISGPNIFQMEKSYQHKFTPTDDGGFYTLYDNASQIKDLAEILHQATLKRQQRVQKGEQHIATSRHVILPQEIIKAVTRIPNEPFDSMTVDKKVWLEIEQRFMALRGEYGKYRYNRQPAEDKYDTVGQNLYRFFGSTYFIDFSDLHTTKDDELKNLQAFLNKHYGNSNQRRNSLHFIKNVDFSDIDQVRTLKLLSELAKDLPVQFVFCEKLTAQFSMANLNTVRKEGLTARALIGFKSDKYNIDLEDTEVWINKIATDEIQLNDLFDRLFDEDVPVVNVPDVSHKFHRIEDPRDLATNFTQ